MDGAVTVTSTIAFCTSTAAKVGHAAEPLGVELNPPASE
jgi:hypothetical protein